MVSIVIVNYHTASLVLQCVDSIEKHEPTLSYEIIVVDNDSGQQELTLLARDGRCQVVALPQNVGFARANNRGIAMSNGNYVLLLNSDTILMNDAISRCLRFVESYQGRAVLGAAMFYEDGSWQRSHFPFPSIRLALRQLLRLQSRVVQPMKPLAADWLVGAFLFIPKPLLNQLPGSQLSDTFFLYCEDIDWGYQFKQLNYPCLFLPDAKIIHLKGKSLPAASLQQKQLAYYYPNLFTLLCKYHSRAYAQCYFGILQLIFRSDRKWRGDAKFLQSLRHISTRKSAGTA